MGLTLKKGKCGGVCLNQGGQWILMMGWIFVGSIIEFYNKKQFFLEGIVQQLHLLF